MPVQAIYPATVQYAGGIRWRDNDYYVGHQNGNVEDKRRRLIELVQDRIDVRIKTSDMDPSDPDADPQNNEWNTYSDVYRRPDDSLIDERFFYWQQNPSTLWFVDRGVLADVFLYKASDPNIGGEDHYKLQLDKLK